MVSFCLFVLVFFFFLGGGGGGGGGGCFLFLFEFGGFGFCCEGLGACFLWGFRGFRVFGQLVPEI